MMHVTRAGKLIDNGHATDVNINCSDYVHFRIKVTGFGMHINYGVKSVIASYSLGNLISCYIILVSDRGTERKFKSNDERFYKRTPLLLTIKN